MVAEKDKVIYEATLGRSTIGSVGGLVAVILGILGLVGVYPLILGSIAVLAIGVMLLFEGAAVAAEYKQAVSHIEGGTVQKAEIGGGMTAEMLAGAVGIVLGILALLGLLPLTLLSVSVLIFGGGLLIGSGVVAQLNSIKIAGAGTESKLEHLATEAAKAGAAGQVLIGLGVIVLGILALLGMQTLVLVLVSVLAIGGISVLTSSAIGGKIFELFHHGASAGGGKK